MKNVEDSNSGKPPHQVSTCANGTHPPTATPPGVYWAKQATSKDNSVSSKFGLCCGKDLDARGIPGFAKGDIVEIEILAKDGGIWLLARRASRPRTIYILGAALLAHGYELYAVVPFRIVRVNNVPPQTGVVQVRRPGGAEGLR